MDKPFITHIVLRPSQSSATYSEQETVLASHLGLGTIRYLHARGLVRGQRAGGHLRYSEQEIAQLRQIRRLQHDLGVNLAGVEVILHLLAHVEALRQELELERNTHEQ
ncbi:MAG TPA: chaperone modulator CbpM [Ktedonobacteraceae bacterium]